MVSGRMGIMGKDQSNLFEECKRKLLKTREESMNGLKALNPSLATEMVGDEADLASAHISQTQALNQRDKLMAKIKEIDEALARMENGTYGICEETGENIEEKRLVAIPWTRLSLEGAEVREREQKRYDQKLA
ncbi:TraR/DksA family transcriptional regulator [bacterium]|jgi:DnaK suppressor protein|nr:TraR/DksA family transcriptional regulator [bacterium]